LHSNSQLDIDIVEYETEAVAFYAFSSSQKGNGQNMPKNILIKKEINMKLKFKVQLVL